MEHDGSGRTVRWVWFGLWTLAVGLTLALLFATLKERPFDPGALEHFESGVLERGRQFTREVRTAATANHLLSLGAMAALCFSAAGARYLGWLEGLGRGRTWLGLLTVAAGVTLPLALLELPLSFYLGHIHEKAYGLTRESATGWLLDHLTGLGLGLGLNLLFWLPVYWLMRRRPGSWWLPAALVNLVLTGVLVILSPLIMLPLEGKVVELKDPRVLAMVERLSARAGVEVEAVRELKVSERTSRVNAMVTGMGATKQVVIYDTMLQQFRPDEVEVVMAHEMSHAIHQDVVTSWLLGSAAEAVSLLAVAWLLHAMVGMGPLRLPAPHAARGLALVLLFSTLLGQVTGPVHNFASRRAEVRADRFALELTENPKAFITTFKKLAAGNPSDVDPPMLVELLSHSHPSIMHRIRMAQPDR